MLKNKLLNSLILTVLSASGQALADDAPATGATLGAHYGIQTFNGSGSSVIINGVSDSLNL